MEFIGNDLTGMTFGRWTVLEFYTRSKGQLLWLCKCICGKQKIVFGGHLKGGKSVSCGCLRKELSIARFTTHGLTNTKEYKSWSQMKRRCNDESGKDYPDYGGRGIKVCERWNDFKNFIEDMGSCPKGMSIDRIKNNLGYSPDNCKWSTPSEQARNRRSNRLLTLGGETKTLAQWAEEKQIDSATIRRRIDAYHWSVLEAITTPVAQTGGRMLQANA